MAENGVYYGDYSHMDGASMGSGLNNFGQRNDQHSTNYGGNLMKPGTGFYSDHYMHISSNAPSAHQQTGYDSPHGGMGVPPPQNTQVSPHDLSQINAPHMPIHSPPNSQSDIEDSKDLDNNYTNALHHSGLPLAKPVPMKRLSEKMISQTRACFNTQSDVLMESSFAATSPALARALIAVQQSQKRQRSEKKAIPSDQRDNKYYERRHRNNYAAKRSRDARKSREDEIAIRASFLEKENAILRAQVSTLREEANSLRQLLLQKRSRH